MMGLDTKGKQVGMKGQAVPSFGAGVDGDGNCNMILGLSFFVTLSNSLAIIPNTLMSSPSYGRMAV